MSSYTPHLAVTQAAPETAVKLENQPHSQTWSPDRQQLENALNSWRECVLRFLRDQIGEVNEDLQAAEE
jgi:hypothetical protein